MRKGKISIIVPFYNCREKLVVLLKHIQENPYINFEVLLGDDASLDNPIELIGKFLVDERFKYFYQEKNIGAGAVRNFLISIANGEYIVLQDADDLFVPEKYKLQVEFLECNLNYHAVGTAASLYYESKYFRNISVPKEITFKNIFLQSGIVHASLMIRASNAKVAKYNEKLKYGEDYYFITQLYCQKAKIGNITLPLYVYNINPKELRRRSLTYFHEIINARIHIADFFSFPINLLFIGFHVIKTTIGAITCILR